MGKDWFETVVPPDESINLSDVVDTLLAEGTARINDYENYIRTNSGEQRLRKWHGSSGVSIRRGLLEDKRFYVEDDGPGIPEGMRGAVFEPGENSVEGETGFSLTTVRRVAEAQDVECRSPNAIRAEPDSSFLKS